MPEPLAPTTARILPLSTCRLRFSKICRPTRSSHVRVLLESARAERPDIDIWPQRVLEIDVVEHNVAQHLLRDLAATAPQTQASNQLDSLNQMQRRRHTCLRWRARCQAGRRRGCSRPAPSSRPNRTTKCSYKRRSEAQAELEQQRAYESAHDGCANIDSVHQEALHNKQLSG